MCSSDLLYVKSAFAAFDPLGVVTITLAEPALPTGVVAVIDVSETTLVFVAGAPPIVTLVAPVNAVPVIVSEVPPNVEPLDGLIEVIEGAPM